MRAYLLPVAPLDLIHAPTGGNLNQRLGVARRAAPREVTLDEAVVALRLVAARTGLRGLWPARYSAERAAIVAPAAFNRRRLQDAGFVGWHTWPELRAGALAEVPRGPGCYVVLRPAKGAPSFLEANPAGPFKDRDPSVSAERLAAEWVADASAVYIGKADVLFTRLKSYARFGAGEPVAHWGGRLIWQLSDADSLLVAWCPLVGEGTARDFERLLLGRFAELYDGRRPFADLSAAQVLLLLRGWRRALRPRGPGAGH